LHQFDHAIRVEDFLAANWKSSFVAAGPENFCEPVQQRIQLSLALFDDSLRDLGDARDFLGQRLIQDLPTQALAERFGNHVGGTPEFTFDGDDLNHD
jgi:hypothetical protein